MTYWQALLYTVIIETGTIFIYRVFSSTNGLQKMKAGLAFSVVLGLNFISHPFIWQIYYILIEWLAKPVAIILVESLAIVIEAELLNKVVFFERKGSYLLAMFLNVTSFTVGSIFEIMTIFYS